jgi:hypothetical protein
MGGRQGLQVGLHDQLAAVAHAIKEPDLASRLLGEAPVEHAEQGRDADASRHQHDWGVAAIEVEVAGRRPCLQQIAHFDVIMKMIRGATGREMAARRRGDALDRDAVVIRVGGVGQGVTTHDRFQAPRGGGNVQTKGQELPRLEAGQELPIFGFEVKGTDRLRLVLDDLACHPEGPEASPGGRARSLTPRWLAPGWRPGGHQPCLQGHEIPPVPPKRNTDKGPQLQGDGEQNPEQELE